MAKLPPVKYPLPQWVLDASIRGLQELAQRLEYEAAAYALVNSHDSVLLAEERLEYADTVRRTVDYFLHL